MARNRKNQSASARFGPAIMAVVLCAVIAGAGLNYVWHRKQIDQLGGQISRSETRLAELRSDNQRVLKRLAELTSEKSLDLRIKAMNLGLITPRPEQILRLREDEAMTSQAAATGVELAQKTW